MLKEDSKTGWLYRDGDFTEEDYEMIRNAGYMGFVYLITELDTGMKYIGQKRMQKKITRPPLKGKKNKRRSFAESDWREYYGSSQSLNEVILKKGRQNYTREILHFGMTNGDLNYLEMREIVGRNALLRNDYYNEFVGGRIHVKHLSIPTQEMIRSTL